jgi:hypothetical protein
VKENEHNINCMYILLQDEPNIMESPMEKIVV